MQDFFHQHETLFAWLALFSIISVVVTLITVPLILTRLPKNYFSSVHRQKLSPRKLGLLHIPILLLKNLLGMLLLLLGVVMLVLPGQGILTILIGLMIIDFPGKYHLERWLIIKPSVLRSVNWIRKKANQPALVIDTTDDSVPLK